MSKPVPTYQFTSHNVSFSDIGYEDDQVSPTNYGIPIPLVKQLGSYLEAIGMNTDLWVHHVGHLPDSGEMFSIGMTGCCCVITATVQVEAGSDKDLDIRVFDRCLTSEEVARLADGGKVK